MDNTVINKLKEINQQYSELLHNYPSCLDKIEKEDNFNNRIVTKESFENYLKMIEDSFNYNKLDIHDFLFMLLSEVKEIFQNEIETFFPFYQTCKIQIKKGLMVVIKIDYYYLGEIEQYDDIIFVNRNIENQIKRFETSLKNIKNTIDK